MALGDFRTELNVLQKVHHPHTVRPAAATSFIGTPAAVCRSPRLLGSVIRPGLGGYMLGHPPKEGLVDGCLACAQVQFLGAVTKTQPFMIVTEYMTGGSLTDLFKAQRLPTLWRALQLSLDCARGLAYLHSRQPTVRRGC